MFDAAKALLEQYLERQAALTESVVQRVCTSLDNLASEVRGVRSQITAGQNAQQAMHAELLSELKAQRG